MRLSLVAVESSRGTVRARPQKGPGSERQDGAVCAMLLRTTDDQHE